VITFHALGRVRRQHQGDADRFPDARFAVEERVVADADTLIAECAQDEADLRRLYAADPARIAVAFKADDLLTPLVKRRPGLRIPGAWDGFECAVRALLGEHIDAAAARAPAGRLIARAGEPIAEAVDGLTHFFPTPQALATADLSGLGLAAGRLTTLRALASATHQGQVDFSAPVEEVLAALTALPGFDAAAAQYVALCALGEPDAFPRGDSIVRRMAGTQRKPLTARELDTRMEAWRPWRGYALIHLWHAAATDAEALLRRAS